MSRSTNTVDETSAWSPASWRAYPSVQQPTYEDSDELADFACRLSDLPPLVTSGEISELKAALADAQEGNCFILHGGDCAESFTDCRSRVIIDRLKVLQQMSLVLMYGLRRPVVKIGRFAGQYAKPRSASVEIRDGVGLPSFRGDIVNGAAFDTSSRRPDPVRLLEAHAHSAMTLNFTRALISDGFGDLNHPECWNLSWIDHSPRAIEYRQMVDEIARSLHLMKMLGEPFAQSRVRDGFYTSHEALLLHYEEAVTHEVPHRRGWYNLSTHLPWIGLRTNSPEGAHVEMLRGIANPVAVKIGPKTDCDTLLRLIEILDPRQEPGRMTLITRMGNDNIASCLPDLIRAVRRGGRRVLWVVDPMHGNTETTTNGYKTRRFDAIRGELEQACAIHAAEGSLLGGVHLELTGEDVTECLGGARALVEGDLDRAYRTPVDPRLNYEQALEIALAISATFRAMNAPPLCAEAPDTERLLAEML